MLLRPLSALLAGPLVLFGLGCSGGASKSLDRSAVLELLNKEARDMKRDGEKLDPSLGVAARWTIQSVDVTQNVGDKEKPWNGTIHFKIDSKTRDANGSVADTFEKTFHYVFDAAAGKWLVSIQPDAPRGR